MSYVELKEFEKETHYILSMFLLRAKCVLNFHSQMQMLYTEEIKSYFETPRGRLNEKPSGMWAFIVKLFIFYCHISPFSFFLFVVSCICIVLYVVHSVSE